jgi:hypothetical protein
LGHQPCKLMFAGLRNSFSSLFDTSKFGLAKRNYIKKNSCNVSWIFFCVKR